MRMIHWGGNLSRVESSRLLRWLKVEWSPKIHVSYHRGFGRLNPFWDDYGNVLEQENVRLWLVDFVVFPS